MENTLYVLGLVVGGISLIIGMIEGANLSAEQNLMVGTILIWILITRAD